MTPAPERISVWTYEDLGLLLGAILPCLLISSLLERLGQMAAPGIFASQALQNLTYQSWLYLLLLGTLYLLAVKRHQQPLWRSLGWTTTFTGAWWCVLLAPVLAIAVSAAGTLLRAPLIPTPAEQLLAGQVSLIAVGVFSTVIGPIFEELLFRGFLQPLLTQSVIPTAAVMLTALPFALLHGSQYQWSRQHVVLVFAAGCAFGVVRQRTGSTAGSALIHMGYNLTLFVVFVSQQA